MHKVHKSETQTQHSHQLVKEIVLYCLTNPASSNSSVKSSMVFRLGMFFFTIHVSAVIEVGISDQRNWMHESAGAEVIFEASWPLRSRVFNCFYSFVC